MLYTSSRSAASATVSIRSCNGMISSSQAITTTVRNSKPFAKCIVLIEARAPGARPVLCHGFADNIDWPNAAKAGAFHSLLLPFRLSEVRHSLGFIWGARKCSAPIPMRHRSQWRKSVIHVPRIRTAGIVA